MISAGRTDRRAWRESRPAFAELEAIKRLIFLAEVTGGYAHVVPISIADGIANIFDAKHKDVPVTSEICAHYLWVEEEGFIRIGSAAKWASPLRDALWRRLLTGEIDCVTSDQSPSNPELKTKGNDNVWKAWGGISGIQLILSVLFSEGVHKRGMSLPLLARVWSTNAAKIFGLYGKKGLIVPGADADLVLVDPEKEWTLQEEDILSRHKRNAYMGSKFKGVVIKTILRGQAVFGEGVQAKKGVENLSAKNKAIKFKL